MGVLIRILTVILLGLSIATLYWQLHSSTRTRIHAKRAPATEPQEANPTDTPAEREICQKPILLKVGEIDDEFGLTHDQVSEILVDAVREWEEATGRKWFTVAEGEGLDVNFLFDGRQADLLAAEDERKSIEAEVAVAKQHQPVSKEETDRLLERLKEYRKKQENLEKILPWAQHNAGPAGASIDVFAFSDPDQLHAVLLHELGHAMGLGHLPQKEAIMYGVREVDRADLHLSLYDVEAALSLCEKR